MSTSKEKAALGDRSRGEQTGSLGVGERTSVDKRERSASVLPPARVTLRIDRTTREMLNQQMRETGASLSQALRVALALGLERSEELDAAFRRASFREGVVAGTAEYRRALATEARAVAQSALEATDSHLRKRER